MGPAGLALTHQPRADLHSSSPLAAFTSPRLPGPPGQPGSLERLAELQNAGCAALLMQRALARVGCFASTGPLNCPVRSWQLSVKLFPPWQGLQGGSVAGLGLSPALGGVVG